MNIKFPKHISLFVCLIFSVILRAQQESNPCIENMSTEQRNQLKNPQIGKMIYNTTTGCLNYYQEKRWRVFCEQKNNIQEEIKYNEETGELQYRINGIWYTFQMIKPEGDTADAHFYTSIPSEEKRSSTSDIPADCKRKPTRPYAGRDLVSFEFVDLEGNQPLHGTGNWTIIRGEGGKFTDSTVSNTRFYGEQGTTYAVRWTISTQCDTLFDDALVRIRPPCDPEPSLSYAGTDQINVIEAKLKANKPLVGIGSWTIVSGLGGHIEDPRNPKSLFTGVEGETYVLRWNVRNECGLTMDDVIIKLKPPCRPLPSIADAGEDQIDIDKCILKAQKPENGEGKWEIVEGRNGKFAKKDLAATRFYGDPGEIYILRWTVTTKCGSSSDDIRIKFASFCPTQIIDARDGKRYKAKRLSGQCWMIENLNYRPEGPGVYCYEDLSSYCNEFGTLYKWSAAMNNEKKEKSTGVCPKGWHVPSDDEWQNLIDSSGYEGAELMEGGISNFNVVLSGSRYTNGKYFNRREYAYFWSSSSQTDNTAWNRYFPSKGEGIDHYSTDKGHGFSLRCVKDE